MCQICENICIFIYEVFGHSVNPNDLAELIESSPLVPKDQRRAITS